jgi:hypothetical protein
MKYFFSHKYGRKLKETFFKFTKLFINFPGIFANSRTQAQQVSVVGNHSAVASDVC